VSPILIVVHRAKDYAPTATGQQIVTFADYIAGEYAKTPVRARVINLCRRFDYGSEGYYCSLLAEARGQKVIPSLQTLGDLSGRALYQIQIDDLADSLDRYLPELDGDQRIVLQMYFGHATDPRLDRLARKVFELFPCPLLEITLKHRKSWKIDDLRARSPARLTAQERASFAIALEEFNRKVWRARPEKKQARYDLAILCDPQERLPPSNRGALKRFIRAGREIGIDSRLITQRDYLRLGEFDGLFIRTTTAIDHYTYRFAKKAESEGLVVIDDSNSILRCTNKIYLADLFRNNKVPAPRTELLYRDRPAQLTALSATCGFPVVIKIPDGSFSRGVEKARDAQELEEICGRLFRESALLLAQEFLYTDFDWRIGVLENRPLYACRYYMVKQHWQIYRHGGRTDSGGFDTMPLEEVPPAILDAALAATRPIGAGFYGVDIKEREGRGLVIEVNDNPSIESGVEDREQGMALYRQIMGVFLRRMEARRGH